MSNGKSIFYDIDEFVERISRDESLAAMLRNIMKKQVTERPSPKSYYYVTHLVNPAHTYWSRLHPDVKRPSNLRRKLARGKLLQEFANIWVRNFPDYIVEEGTIDGVWVELPCVRGSVDYRIGESIVEFKTKDELPRNVEEVFSLYPHDLEQLLFYSVIHPSLYKENYLVFMENTDPYKLKTFKVITKDHGIIKSLIKNRIKNLDEAIKKEDPSKLGRCRYYNKGCHFQDSGHCSCEKIEPIPTKQLKKAVEIFEDSEFTRRLEDARRKSLEIPQSFFWVLDIIAPRKHYMREVRGLESPWVPPETKEEYQACLWACIRQLPIRLGLSERKRIVDSQREIRVRVPFRWAKIKTSIHQNGDIVPYIRKVSFSEDKKSMLTPSQYYQVELGIICSLYGKNKGLIFVVYPKLDKSVQVFQVAYKKVDYLLKRVKRNIEIIEEAKREENLLSLPVCPGFMDDEGKCPLMKDCHSEKGAGCKDM